MLFGFFSDSGLQICLLAASTKATIIDIDPSYLWNTKINLYIFFFVIHNFSAILHILTLNRNKK